MGANATLMTYNLPAGSLRSRPNPSSSVPMKKPSLIRRFAERPLVRDTLSTTFWSSLGKGAGFLIPVFIAAWFGATSRTDAFFFCYTAIFFISTIIGRVFESVIVPFVARAHSRGDNPGRLVGRLLIFVSVGATAATAALLALFLPFLPRFTSFPAQETALIRSLLLLISPLVPLVLGAGILAGALNARRRFVLPAVSPAVRAGLLLITALLLKSRVGIHAIAVGYVIGEGARFLVLLFGVRRAGFRLGGAGRPPVRDFFVTAWHQSLGMGAIGVSQMIDKVMASWLGIAGCISILFYAEWLYNIPVIFLSSGLMVTILSHWSDRVYRRGGDGDLAGSVHRALRLVVALSFFLVLVLVFFSRPIVTAAFGRRGFGEANLLNIARVYLIFLPVLFADMISIVYTRVCIIYRRTVVIRNLGILRLVIKVILNLALIGPLPAGTFPVWLISCQHRMVVADLGYAGLAVSTLLTHFLVLLYLSRRVNRLTADPPDPEATPPSEEERVVVNMTGHVGS